MTDLARVIVIALILGVSSLVVHAEQASSEQSGQTEPISTFKMGITSILANLPWSVAERRGLINELERRYRLRLDLLRFSSEADALEAFARGDVQAITTTLNAAIGAAETSQRDAYLLMVSGFSNGSHGILSRTAKSPLDLAGKRVHVDFGSSGHYLLFRILERVGLGMDDIELIDTPESQLIDGVINDEIDTLVASGSPLARAQTLEELQLIADSSSLSGEMVCGILMDRATLDNQPRIGEMLVDAWYTMVDRFLTEDGAYVARIRMQLADLAGLPERHLGAPDEAVQFLQSPELARQYIDTGSLRRVVENTERFRIAAYRSDCATGESEACRLRMTGNEIVNGTGTKILLDTGFLDEYAEKNHGAE